MIRSAMIAGFLVIVGWGLDPVAARGEDPLIVARQIDHEIQLRLVAAKVPASPLADDAEFLRRAYLDITGRIPTVDQARAFLDSAGPDKRRQLIEELLASPSYGQHFATIWRDLIVLGEENKYQLRREMGPFVRWLAEGFNQGRGWDVMVREMLTAEGKADQNPTLVFLLAHRENGHPQANRIIASTSQLFLGLQLQCAECHRHPYVRSWKQEDFWGLAAFFSHVRDAGGIKNGQNAKLPMITETDGPKGDLGGKPIPLPLPGAAIVIPNGKEPTKTMGVARAKFFKGEEPALGDQGPYRPVFAAWLTAPENQYFARASVNRMWAHFFARGLVNPIADMNEGNDPSHPALLERLASEFSSAGFDCKHLIRCICNSQTYQRSSRPLPENASDEELFSRMAIKVLSPEVFFDALNTARGGTTRVEGGPREQFLKFFNTKAEGDETPTELTHGIPQFLRLMNGPEFNRGGYVITTLAKAGASPETVIEGLFLATLARRPSPEEVEKMAGYVGKQVDAKTGYAGVLWILMNTPEFICNR